MGCEKFGTGKGLARTVIFTLKLGAQLAMIILIIISSITFNDKRTYAKCIHISESNTNSTHYCNYTTNPLPQNVICETRGASIFINDLNPSITIGYSSTILILGLFVIAYEFIKTMSTDKYSKRYAKKPLGKKAISIFAYNFIQIIICAPITYMILGNYDDSCFEPKGSNLFASFPEFLMTVALYIYLISWGGYLVYTDIFEFKHTWILEILVILFPFIALSLALAAWLIDKSSKTFGAKEFGIIFLTIFLIGFGIILNVFLFIIAFASGLYFWLPGIFFVAQIALSFLYEVFQDKDEKDEKDEKD